MMIFKKILFGVLFGYSFQKHLWISQKERQYLSFAILNMDRSNPPGTHFWITLNETIVFV